ncbi:MAG: ABC transporter permease [Candidatus Methanoplasma sp.]|jgi:NitT/TauT family transport system permease protein|nr:ABC transporter permease [Candidatus Methanoplasma sp.]
MKIVNTTNSKAGKLEDRSISRLYGYILGFVPIIAFVILWQIVSDAELIRSSILPPPYEVFLEAIKLLKSGLLVNNIKISMVRILTGLFISIAVAVPLGFLLGGWFKRLETALNPLFLTFSQANPFTLFPLFIVLLGLGESSKVAMIILVAVWPILFNTISGIRNIDPELVKVSRTFGFSKTQLFARVMLPAALPSVLSGIRVAVIISFFVLIGAEMIGGSSGLGYMIFNACPLHSTHELNKMWAGIVTVALLGVLLNWITYAIEKRFSFWKHEVN